MTVNAVDQYFNPVTVINDPVTFASSDTAAFTEGPATLVAGTATHAVVFITAPANSDVTGTDLTNNKTGASDFVSVQPGANSTLLNVVHASPDLSTVVANQPGVNIFTFHLSIPNGGSQQIQLNSLVIHAKDKNGLDVPMDGAFQNLILAAGAQSLTLTGSLGASAFATLGGAMTVNPGPAPLAVTLTADTAATVTAKTAEISIDDNTAFNAQLAVPPGTSVGIASAGDPTGFPMVSELMVFSDGSLAQTYGNYPNPFHPGSEKTTIEFYLTSASTVSLELYDVMGNRVVSLLKQDSLPSGLQKVLWDGRNGSGQLVLNGIYFAQLDVNGTKLLLKIAVVK